MSHPLPLYWGKAIDTPSGHRWAGDAHPFYVPDSLHMNRRSYLAAGVVLQDGESTRCRHCARPGGLLDPLHRLGEHLAHPACDEFAAQDHGH